MDKEWWLIKQLRVLNLIEMVGQDVILSDRTSYVKYWLMNWLYTSNTGVTGVKILLCSGPI